MPPRKKRALQAEEEDEGLPAANGAQSVTEASPWRPEEPESAVQLGSGSTFESIESPDPQPAARLEELEQHIRRRTYVVRPGAKVAFNRRDTYVVSFNPLLEEEPAGEDAVSETGDFFVGHGRDDQERPPTTTPVADQETKVVTKKPRGWKKNEKITSNPEGNSLKVGSPKKRGRKKKIDVSVDQTAANIPVTSPNIDEPAANIPVTSPNIDEPVPVDSIKDNDFTEEKKNSKPRKKGLENLPPKKPEKWGRKKRNDVLVDQTMANVIEESSNIDEAVVMHSVEGSDSAENLLSQTDDEKRAQEPGGSKDNPKKKTVKRRKQ